MSQHLANVMKYYIGFMCDHDRTFTKCLLHNIVGVAIYIYIVSMRHWYINNYFILDIEFYSLTMSFEKQDVARLFWFGDWTMHWEVL